MAWNHQQLHWYYNTGDLVSNAPILGDFPKLGHILGLSRPGHYNEVALLMRWLLSTIRKMINHQGQLSPHLLVRGIVALREVPVPGQYTVDTIW